MEKNYYKILEIDKNASSEIIEKAYKTLVKKYHPDLQESTKKEEYEQKLKLINEAYDTLSDENKRKEYDNTLIDDNILKEKVDKLHKENSILKNEINNLRASALNITSTSQENPVNYEETNNSQNNLQELQDRIRANQEYQKELQLAREKAYYDAYIQDLKNRGYKIRYKKTLKDYIKSIISIIIVLIILILLWQIPFVHNHFINLYNNNSLFHTLLEPFVNLFSQ